MSARKPPSGTPPRARSSQPPVLIVGGGVTGLFAALGLARAGHAVRVLERDAAQLPADPDSAFAHWERRGAPQLWHSHAFLARLRNLLRARLPDVLARLLAEGAGELPLAHLLRAGPFDRRPQPGDEDLTLLACRRVTFEWVLRMTARAEPRLEYCGGARVLGLVREGARVCGLRVRKDGATREIPARLVVDAGGRRSKLPAWLEAAGFPRPEEQSEPCGIFYCSRFYRLRPGVTPPPRDTPIGADLGFFKYAIFHGDAGVFSITLAARPQDRPLRALLRADAFDAVARALPATARWVDPALATPASRVYAMDGLRNTRRFLVTASGPLAPSVVAIGDAAIHTNPLYGRGCSLGLLHAFLLVDAMAGHAADPRALACALEEEVEREIAPWYEFTRRQDRAAGALAEYETAHAHAQDAEPPQPAPHTASASGCAREREQRPRTTHREPESAGDHAARRHPAQEKPAPPASQMREILQHGLLPALRCDATVLRAFMRGFNLLDPPGSLLKNPEVLRRVLKMYKARHTRASEPSGPDRAALLRILARVG